MDRKGFVMKKEEKKARCIVIDESFCKYCRENSCLNEIEESADQKKKIDYDEYEEFESWEVYKGFLPLMEKSLLFSQTKPP